MYVPLTLSAISVTATDDLRSLGAGIKREVFQTLIGQYLHEEAAQWFNPRADGFSTLATTHPQDTAYCIPETRLDSLTVFGAVVALCLIRGVSVPPLDPVLIHFFIHNCNIRSITPGIVGEWHPALKKTIDDWLQIGPNAKVAAFQEFFTTYFELQVGANYTSASISSSYMFALGRLPQ